MIEWVHANANITCISKGLIILALLAHPFSSYSLNADSLYQQANLLKYDDADAAIKMYRQCLDYYNENQAQQKAIDVQIAMINLYAGIGNYYKAFSYAWGVLPFINNPTNANNKIHVLLQLSSLYLVFEDYAKASNYLEEALQLVNQSKDLLLQRDWLPKLYKAKAWLTTKSEANFPKAKELLHQALKEDRKKNSKIGILYTQMQLAQLYMLEDSVQQARQILYAVAPQVKSNTQYKHSRSLFYDHLGQLHMKLQQYDTAAKYFQQCITAINTYKNHRDNIVEVYDSLASCYHYLGKKALAYQYLRHALAEKTKLFGYKSATNKALFEIKDTYEEKLKAQQLQLLKQEKDVLLLKMAITISILGLAIAIIVGWSKIRTQKLAYLAQKKEDELADKNKALTTSALKLIERDALLENIKKALASPEFNTTDPKTVSRLISTINTNKANRWEEFELYFTSVNEGFYDQLKSRYALLSVTDLKMCALIKLGLSSKEMAEIMAIEPDSINTARSRIRKKMGLPRATNLIEHLRGMK